MKKIPFPVWILVALVVIILVEKMPERVEKEPETEGVPDEVSSHGTCEDLAPHIIELVQENTVGSFLNFTILKMYEIEEIPLEGKAFQNPGEMKGDKLGRKAIQQAMYQRREGEPFRVYPAEKDAVLNCLAIAMLKNGGRNPIHFYLIKDEDGDYFHGYEFQ